MSSTAQDIRSLIIEMTQRCGPDKSICPSEVARALSPDDWRGLMDDVRASACQLHEQGVIEITQKYEVVKNFDFKGPIRLRQKKGQA